MARYKQSVKPCPRRQLATVSKEVYFEIKNIAPSPSKPAIVFWLNKGEDKIILPDVINAKILEYTHWKDIFVLCSLSDNQKRGIDGNKLLDQKNQHQDQHVGKHTSLFLEELCLLQGSR
jgi:hypothetical protein